MRVSEREQVRVRRPRYKNLRMFVDALQPVQLNFTPSPHKALVLTFEEHLLLSASATLLQVPSNISFHPIPCQHYQEHYPPLLCEHARQLRTFTPREPPSPPPS